MVRHIDGDVGLLVGQEQDLLTTTGQIAMKFGMDIYSL